MNWLALNGAPQTTAACSSSLDSHMSPEPAQGNSIFQNSPGQVLLAEKVLSQIEGELPSLFRKGLLHLSPFTVTVNQRVYPISVSPLLKKGKLSLEATSTL